MVQGHIDTTGIIINNQLVDDNWLLEIMINKKWIKYLASKLKPFSFGSHH